VGGDSLDYNADVATPTSDITTFKIIINNTLYTDEAHDDDGNQEQLFRDAPGQVLQVHTHPSNMFST
jgi:hypothetical protein